MEIFVENFLDIWQLLEKLFYFPEIVESISGNEFEFLNCIKRKLKSLEVFKGKFSKFLQITYVCWYNCSDFGDDISEFYVSK